jgi:hypothetical protein
MADLMSQYYEQFKALAAACEAGANAIQERTSSAVSALEGEINALKAERTTLHDNAKALANAGKFAELRAANDRFSYLPILIQQKTIEAGRLRVKEAGEVQQLYQGQATEAGAVLEAARPVFQAIQTQFLEMQGALAGIGSQMGLRQSMAFDAGQEVKRAEKALQAAIDDAAGGGALPAEPATREVITRVA